MEPARDGARELAAHQAAADDAERDGPLSHGGGRRLVAGAPSWTIAISAARHRGRVVVLDDVAAVDDAGRALLHDRVGPAQDLLVGRSAAAAHEHGNAAGDLDHAAVVAEVVRRVGLDHVGAELDRLADERDDLLEVAVDPVGPSLARLA